MMRLRFRRSVHSKEINFRSDIFSRLAKIFHAENLGEMPPLTQIGKIGELVYYKFSLLRVFQFELRVITRLGTRLIAICFLSTLTISAEPLPEVLLHGLESQRFADRELAQSKLLDWGRLQPEASMLELLKQSRAAADPEVRARCHDVLLALIKDQYLSEGVGFIGISMGGVIPVAVPDDKKPRYGILIGSANDGGPGQKAGLKANDSIVGLNGAIWYEPFPIATFTDKIKAFKPRQKIKLQVVREKEVLEVEVQLMRRPTVLEKPMRFGDQLLDLEVAQKAEIEAHFQRWLAKQKIKK
jgi:hypothetical protein